MAEKHEITILLGRYRDGDAGALKELFSRVYDELRQIAGAKMSRERKGHTLQPTALVNEAFVRLFSGSEPDPKNRAHFFGIAANVMRRILVDYSRQRSASKRGGGLINVTFEEKLFPDAGPSVEDVLILDQLLTQLAELDERCAKVVELRYFAGLSIEEAAEALGCSVDTVKRSWQKAKVWLLHALKSEKKNCA